MVPGIGLGLLMLEWRVRVVGTRVPRREEGRLAGRGEEGCGEWKRLRLAWERKRARPRGRLAVVPESRVADTLIRPWLDRASSRR